MSDCKCNTQPPATPCVTIQPPVQECNRIRMFFGHHVLSPSESGYESKPTPGQLKKLYYTPGAVAGGAEYVQNGFIIEDYSAQELVDSGILTNNFGKDRSNNFDLTESELLSTSSWESWLSYQTAMLLNLDPSVPGQSLELNTLNTGLVGFRTFGFWVLKSLEIDLKRVRADSVIMYASMRKGGTESFFSKIQSFFINAPRTNNYQSDRGEYYPPNITTDCKYFRRASDIEKLRLAYEWLKNIHDTYYGKQFLVRIGDPVPRKQDQNITYPLDTLCIKDNNGDYPSLEYPYYIDGDGSSQGYYLSDVIDNSGGFPLKTESDLIGLEDLSWIQTEDGKIGSFAKIGTYSAEVSPAGCSTIGGTFFEMVEYPKFRYNVGPSPTDCYMWTMDISGLNNENYLLSGNSEQNLYISCSVTEKIYVDDYGTWVHFVLSDSVPLKQESKDLAQVFANYKVISTNSTNYFNLTPSTIFKSLVTNGFGVYGTVFDLYSKYAVSANTTHGARSDTSILNIVGRHQPCLMPEAVVIPFRSNLYNYGPFYYGDSEPGGVDVVVESDLAPWNFISPTGTGSTLFDYTYDTMEEFGKELVSAGAKDVQKLEKGRITTAGLPCYCIGYWVDDKGCYDPDKEIGPTLLTDINVEYGSNGFNTTYNFSTYSPRFGRPEKYITDAWKRNIKDTKYLNQYLNSLDKNTKQNNQSYKLRLINGKERRFFPARLKNTYNSPSPIVTYKSTTHQVMFAGYQLDTNQDMSTEGKTLLNNIDFDGYTTAEIYDAIPISYPSGEACDRYICETEPVPIQAPDLYYTPPPHRFYTFAETDKAYTSEYIQNTYHQLSGMTMDGLFLPVSLRGANKDPNVKEYEKFPENAAGGNDQPNRFKITNNKLIPNSSWKNNGRIPRFAKRCENNGSFIEWDSLDSQLTYDRNSSNNPGRPIPSKTRDEIPPFGLNANDGFRYCYALQINQKYLNPILSIKNLLGDTPDNVEGWDERKNNSDRGFVISNIVFGQDHIDYQISHTNDDDFTSTELSALDKTASQSSDEFIRQQFKNFRFPSLRGPLVLQGWGYDTTGKPIPNSADGWGHAIHGEFRKENLTDKFMKNWLQNPKTWPVGPVDLRFDRERGVWTCPSPNKIVVARLKEKLSPNSSASAELINPEADGIRFYENYSISGPNGENVKLDMANTQITVYDFLGIELCACDIVYAYYDDNRYIVLESNRAYKDPNEECTDVCTTDTTDTTTTTPGCDWCGLECLQTLPQYNPFIEQILGHDGLGCLKWFDVAECPTPTS